MGAYFVEAALPPTNTGKINAMFEKYKDPEDPDGVISGETLMQLCADMGVDPADPVMVAVCWKFEAAVYCEFSQEEFVGGCQRLGVDTIEGLKGIVPGLRDAMADKGEFKKVYLFAFGWAKENAQKGMDIELVRSTAFQPRNHNCAWIGEFSSEAL